MFICRLCFNGTTCTCGEPKSHFRILCRWHGIGNAPRNDWERMLNLIATGCAIKQDSFPKIWFHFIVNVFVKVLIRRKIKKVEWTALKLWISWIFASLEGEPCVANYAFDHQIWLNTAYDWGALKQSGLNPQNCMRIAPGEQTNAAIKCV